MAGDLKSASKASQFQNKIDQLGNLGTSISEFSFDLSRTEQIVAEFISSIKESIQQNDLPVTGAIEDISMSVEGDTIIIYGNEHLIYVDRGVNGSEEKLYDTPHEYTDKMPPVNVFVEWIKRKNTNLRDNEFFYGKPSPFQDVDGEAKAIQQMAYAMAVKRFKEGVAPVPLYTQHIPKLIEDMKKEVKTFTAANIKSMIVNRYDQDVMNKKKV